MNSNIQKRDAESTVENSNATLSIRAASFVSYCRSLPVQQYGYRLQSVLERYRVYISLRHEFGIVPTSVELKQAETRHWATVPYILRCGVDDHSR